MMVNEFMSLGHSSDLFHLCSFLSPFHAFLSLWLIEIRVMVRVSLWWSIMVCDDSAALHRVHEADSSGWPPA